MDKEFARPYLKKNPSQERTGGVAQGIDPEFNLQYHKKIFAHSTLIKIRNYFNVLVAHACNPSYLGS
jgi:hypothetical protein